MEKQLVENVAPHSVEVSQNAKGDLSFSVKVYAENEIDAALRALATVKRIRTELQAVKS